jgi:hypothetical protein
MDRRAKDFLNGFQRAAVLTRSLRETPSSHTSPEDYLKDVADLNADSDDLTRRGLAVGCLAALGED